MPMKDWLHWPWANQRTARSRDKPIEDKTDGEQLPPVEYRAASYNRGDRSLQSSEMIYAAVARVASSLAVMPLHLMRGGEICWDHPLNRLVCYAPSARMNAYDWKCTMQANRQEAGRAYSVIRRAADGVTPLRLVHVPPERVVDVVVESTDEVWHRVTWESGTVEWIPDCDMIFLRGLSSNGVKGVSLRAVLGDALEYDSRVRDYMTQQMDGVNSTVTINVPNTGLAMEKQVALIDEFWKIYKASGGKAVVLQGGMTLNDVTRSPIDAKALDIDKQTANRVATVNMIPPHMLGDRTDTSFATAEQDALEFRQTTLLSVVTQWETELERKLLTYEMVTRDGYHFAFDMRALLRADAMTMANKHMAEIRSGVKTINEARREEGDGPVEGGDTLLISKDLAPLTVVIAQAMAAQEASANNTAPAKPRGKRR